MWYLCVFYHRLLDYRKPKVESLAELFGAFSSDDTHNPERSNSLEWRLPQHHHHPDSPFHFVNLPPELETSQRVRSVKIKSYAELEEEMMAKIPKFKARPINKKILEALTLPTLPRRYSTASRISGISLGNNGVASLLQKNFWLRARRPI